ncbi:gephyrin-like molybdotransferase Glp [Paenibacillus mesophilus]|uniref:molybdopterin molybdotransferase MoeA n=1 Tax=Paenibacillus mesophilus TaxID=2582849 RepID=UPI001EE4299A|nr:gephyrin-like molybdotransferase Glp [Paenibacillus mesophilus]
MINLETTGNGKDAKFHRKALTVEEARRTVLSRVHPVEAVEIGLMESIGRRLAEEVRTKEPIPHFRRSGMDGYAVRIEDIAQATSSKPVQLEVIEQIPCGKEPIHPITNGKASRIMTGGMVPEGADAVIMLEMTEEIAEGDRAYVHIRKTDSRGANITPIGEEAGTGALVLGKGQVIGAGQTAILAALGYSCVKVFRKPKVAVISTGTELLQVSEPLQMGKIRNSNAYMLAAQILSAGGEPRLIGQIPDDYARAERMLYEILSSDADLVLTTGGVSVGDYDIMADFFMKWEGTTLFNKIAMRPGSPTTAGVWRDKLLFGLSGNPSACYVGFELFVRPVLIGMQEGEEESARALTAYLDEDYMKVNAYTRYVRGFWHSDNGKNYVKPVGLDKSSAVISIKDANCLMVIPPTKTGIGMGEIVNIIPLTGAMFP